MSKPANELGKRVFWKVFDKITDKVLKGNCQPTVLDKNGCECPDPTPVALAVKERRPPTIQELIAQMVNNEQWRQEREAAGEEEFEDADDFDTGDDDDDDRHSPYEENFDHSANIDHLKKNIAEGVQKRRRRLFEEEEPVERVDKREVIAKAKVKKKVQPDPDPEDEDED